VAERRCRGIRMRVAEAYYFYKASVFSPNYVHEGKMCTQRSTGGLSGRPTLKPDSCTLTTYRSPATMRPSGP